MGYNRENYARIRESYKTKYLKAYAEADRRLEEIHAKSPEIAEIDRQLARTGAEIAIAALGSGEGYQQKLASVEEQNRALQEQRAAELEKMGYNAYCIPSEDETGKEIIQCRDYSTYEELKDAYLFYGTIVRSPYDKK